jgi:hypothetical protein
MPGSAFGPVRTKLAVGPADNAEEQTAEQIVNNVIVALKARSDPNRRGHVRTRECLCIRAKRAISTTPAWVPD